MLCTLVVAGWLLAMPAAALLSSKDREAAAAARATISLDDMMGKLQAC